MLARGVYCFDDTLTSAPGEEDDRFLTEMLSWVSDKLRLAITFPVFLSRREIAWILSINENDQRFQRFWDERFIPALISAGREVSGRADPPGIEVGQRTK